MALNNLIRGVQTRNCPDATPQDFIIKFTGACLVINIRTILRTGSGGFSEWRTITIVNGAVSQDQVQAQDNFNTSMFISWGASFSGGDQQILMSVTGDNGGDPFYAYIQWELLQGPLPVT